MSTSLGGESTAEREAHTIEEKSKLCETFCQYCKETLTK